VAVEPTAGIVDSQSVKVPPLAGEHGYNDHKCINGRKRHILVDTLLLAVVVTAANADDRVGAQLLTWKSRLRFPQLKHIGTDSGYVGAKWHDWFRWFCGRMVEIVKRGQNAQAFEVVGLRSYRGAGSPSEPLLGSTVRVA